MSSSLGKSLERSKRLKLRNTRRNYRDIVEADREAVINMEQQAREAPTNTLKSIWETNALENFLSIADARGDGYFAERDVRVVISGNVHVVQDNRVVPQSDDKKDWLKLSEMLTVPRRPIWDYHMSAEEVQAGEKKAFLDWRRSLAHMEEVNKVVMTPYEKNLEVWRQLWRVVERADIVVVIVDARNPLIFRSKDFERYVHDTKNSVGKPKKLLLLLNKADLLTDTQRKAWAEYFQASGDTFVFFSAKPLQEPPSNDSHELPDEEEVEGEEGIDRPARLGERQEAELLSKVACKQKNKVRHKKKSLRAPIEVANPYELAEKQKALKRLALLPKPKEIKPITEDERARDKRLATQRSIEPWSVLDPIQLLDRFALLREEAGMTDDNVPLMVGLVGYPNVGKSSTINAIIGAKKVVVSATPGKTKHFQTLSIPNERRVALCDCPGLVFPSFASTKEHMVCDGILPVDTATDTLQATAIVCRRIPREVLERKLHIGLMEEDDMDESHSLAERLLNAFARRRGYMASHERPNRARAGKELLKLYVDGALVYVEPPPNYRPSMEVLSLEHFLLHCAEEKSLPHSSSGDGEWEDEYEDLNSEEEQAWADLEAADELRALSDDGDYGAVDMKDAAAPPMFYARPHGMRCTFTRQEHFNLEANVERMADVQERRQRKKKANPQIEPDPYTFINREGEVELRIDDDDGVIEITTSHGAPAFPYKPKAKSKRHQRREIKKSGAIQMHTAAQYTDPHGYNAIGMNAHVKVKGHGGGFIPDTLP